MIKYLSANRVNIFPNIVLVFAGLPGGLFHKSPLGHDTNKHR